VVVSDRSPICAKAEGKTFVLSSTLRTTWYQNHFREVWDKYNELADDRTPECATIKQKVTNEKLYKHGIGYEPGKLNPKHVTGDAIDISYKKIGLTLRAVQAPAQG